LVWGKVFHSVFSKYSSKWNWDNVFSTPDTAAWPSTKYLNNNGSEWQLIKLLNKKLLGLFWLSNLNFSGWGSINIPLQLNESSNNFVLEYNTPSNAPNSIYTPFSLFLKKISFKNKSYWHC